VNLLLFTFISFLIVSNVYDQTEAKESEFKALFTNAKCTEQEGFWTGTKVRTDIGDNFGSMLHICTYNNYRIIAEINRSSAGGFPMSIGGMTIEKKEGKKGRYKSIALKSIFTSEGLESLLSLCNSQISSIIDEDQYGKLVKNPEKLYEIHELLFVPNVNSISIHFGMDLDWMNIDYNVHGISEGDVDVVRSFEIPLDTFIEWLN
jgi:hypothetical protein